MNSGVGVAVPALREMALNGLRQGDAAQAEQYFARLLEQVPDDAEALQFVASRHLARGDTSRALAMLATAVKAHPEHPDLLHQLGVAQTVAGDLSSDLPHTSEGRAGRRSLVIGEGTTAVQFRSVSGDLRVVGPSAGDHLRIPVPPTPPQPPAPPAPGFAAAELEAELAAANGEIEAANAEIEAARAQIDAESGEGGETAADPGEEARLEILRALERGEIDIDEATKRLGELDGPTDV